MKIRNYATVFLALFSFASYGADIKYPVSSIPDSLKENVNVVVREDHLHFKILSKSRASYKVHLVYTILNDKAKHYAGQVVGYDKLSKIKYINGAVYDAAGKQIKKLKNSEIYDQSAFDGYSLYSDNRLKWFDLSHGTYPYTVEYEYEIELKFLFYIPSFFVVSGEKKSVERSSYCLQYPAELAPRYKTYNIDVKPVEAKTDDGQEILTWNFANVKPITFELHGDRGKIIPMITAAPSSFEYDHYTGTMSTWDGFGQWIRSLNAGRDVLPQETKNKIKAITEKLKTPEEKIKAVYEYLQSKTRYVSIQLGIGGYQPFEASVVDETGYGDCKALSNYTVAMLQSIGIKAHYVLVEAGENPDGLDVDFPSPQFNHAIVAVPNGADTLWLECTSQTNPFGYQGTFTGNRKALMITDEGARVVNTTRYLGDKNITSRTADVFVDMTGNARATVKTTYTGLQYETNNLNFILDDQYDLQRKWIQENTHIASFDINSFTMTNQKNKIPSAVVTLDLNLRRYATTSGKRIFLAPNLMNKSSYIPTPVKNRKTNVKREKGETELDTIWYHLPEGIYPEFLPEPVKISSRFGEYEATFSIDQDGVVYTRKLKMKDGEFPPESYQELIDFYKGVNKADQVKLVFLSKT